MSPHVVDRLSAFLDDELPPRDRDAVASHLRDCQECGRILAELAAVDDAARRLPVEAPDGYFESFVPRLRARLVARRSRRTWVLPVWSLAAAAALLLAVVTPTMLRMRTSGPPQAPAASRVETTAGGAEERAPRPAAEPEGAPPIPPATAAPGMVGRPEDAAARRERKRVAPEPQRSGETAAEEPMPLEKAKDAADEDRLRSLGYVASGRAAPVSPPPVEPKKEASEAREAGFTAPPSQAEEARPADSVAAGRRADVETEPGAAPRQRQSTPSGRPSSASAEGTAVLTPADLHYRALLRTRPTTAEGARSLQRAWNAFARSSTAGRWADEARVRAVEAGAAAYRFSGAPADRTAVEEDAAAYLGRSDAEQKARVRALLNDLDR